PAREARLLVASRASRGGARAGHRGVHARRVARTRGDARDRRAGAAAVEDPQSLQTNEDDETMIDLDLRRRFYAEELEAVCKLRSPALVDAFAMVPRERFPRPGGRNRVVRTSVDHGRHLLRGRFARRRAERPPRQGDGRRPDARSSFDYHPSDVLTLATKRHEKRERHETE